MQLSPCGPQCVKHDSGALQEEFADPWHGGKGKVVVNKNSGA